MKGAPSLEATRVKGTISKIFALRRLQTHLEHIAPSVQSKCTHVALPLNYSVDTSNAYIYNKFFENGNIEDYMKVGPDLRMPSVRQKYILLYGTWTGLYQLNRGLKIMHGKISPVTIFVNQFLEGVIGNLEESLVIDAGDTPTCNKEDQDFGAPCYGAPFERCDPRRDQVALLMINLEVLSGIPWQMVCENELPKKGVSTLYEEFFGRIADSDAVRTDELLRKLFEFARDFTGAVEEPVDTNEERKNVDYDVAHTWIFNLIKQGFMGANVPPPA